MALFDLSPDERISLLDYTAKALEEYYAHTKEYKVAPKINLPEVRSFIRDFAKHKSLDQHKSIDHMLYGLQHYAVQVAHPNYFGLFNPRPAFPSILADLMTATTNPQMAAWSHNPFTAQVEVFLIEELGKRFGYTNPDGTFCSGGAEANQTAVLCALNKCFPQYLQTGLRDLEKQPVLYCSAEAHHSVAKAARMCGLGIEAVRNIDVDQSLRMKPDVLHKQIQNDISQGFHPFMVVATAGTTGPGAIDPLPEISNIAKQHSMWFHVDGAFGGALILDPDHKELLAGIELSDSITFDIHKWLAAPMGTSTFITAHKEILSSTFRITADYMPKEGTEFDAEDPYTHSIQWSRRSLGLRMYSILLFFGWEGFASTINHHCKMGKLLNEQLTKNGWIIKNESEMPITCFVDNKHNSEEETRAIIKSILDSGKAWISVYPVKGELTLRACITNYATTQTEVKELVASLNEARSTLFG